MATNAMRMLGRRFLSNEAASQSAVVKAAEEAKATGTPESLHITVMLS